MVEDEPTTRLTGLHAAPPRQVPSMRMPNELLDEVFKHVFAELEREPLRDRVRIYAPFSLVCEAWQRVAVAHAYANVVVDAAKDPDAIAFLDPVGGAGSHLLSLVKSVKLSAFEPLTKAAGPGDDAKQERASEHMNAPPARRPAHLHGPADDDTSALPIVASVARVLAKCSNLSSLTIDPHLEPVSCKVAEDHAPVLIWPNLTRLILTWNCSFIDFLPVLARLSHLQELIGICLLLDTGDENNDFRGTMTQELVDKHPVQPLERLQNFRIRSFGEAPIGNQAVLRLLSPRAPLRRVTWAGHIPPGMCKELSRGTSEIEELTFTWMGATSNLTKQLLPQLFELGRRPIKRLTLDIEPILGFPLTQFMPPITEILKNLPYGVRFSRAIDMDITVISFRRAFPTGGAEFAAIKARPTASITFQDTNICKGSFDGKPLLQFGMFRVEESDDDVNLRFFGRFGDPDIEGDVTEWMLLKIVASEDDEEQ
ncbi:hypothetical protein JCM8115_006443 [Rhodotorula mucilaginosa]